MVRENMDTGGRDGFLMHSASIAFALVAIILLILLRISNKHWSAS